MTDLPDDNNLYWEISSNSFSTKSPHGNLKFKNETDENTTGSDYMHSTWTSASESAESSHSEEVEDHENDRLVGSRSNNSNRNSNSNKNGSRSEKKNRNAKKKKNRIN